MLNLPHQSAKELKESIEVINILPSELVPITHEIISGYSAINAPVTLERIASIYYHFLNLCNLLFLDKEIYENYIPYLYDNILMTYSLGQKHREFFEEGLRDKTKPVVFDTDLLISEFLFLEIVLIHGTQLIVNTFLNFNPAIIYTINDDNLSIQDIANIEERRKLIQN